MAAACVRRAVLSRSLSRFRCSGGRWSSTGRGQYGILVTSECVEAKPPAFWVRKRRCESGGGAVPETRGGRGFGGGGGGRGGGGGGGRGGGRLLWAAVAFSLFSRSDEEKKDEAQQKEDEIILLLKKAKLSIYRDQFQAASGFLHQAAALAHQTNNNQAIIYTYSLMANLAYVQGQLDNAEKLFKAAMSFMLSGGTPEDDNAVIEMSLKLATIYAEQNKVELAEHGFRFCTESLEAKLEKELPAEEQTEETGALRKETRLLLGLCLDSRARYRASKRRLLQAEQDYQSALDICRQEQGDAHPQTLVLMSDLATVLDLQGRHDDALELIQRAVDLSRSVGHPDQHVLLGNLAGILVHTGRTDDSVRLYKEALVLAREAGDQEAVDRIQEGLEEVKKRRNQKTTKEENAQE